MQYKINEKILSIPPHISTSWANIASIYMKGNLLVVTMQDDNQINISDLSTDTIDAIFKYHAVYLDKGLLDIPSFHAIESKKSENLMDFFEQMGPNMRVSFGTMDQTGNPSLMQHSPEYADSPDLPQELLEKIGAIYNALSMDKTFLPKAEPKCNCFNCQIANTVNPQLEDKTEEEIIKDEELTFRQWDISQMGEKLFAVTNPLDDNEKYNVYLGEPVGCTCGKEGCEHIIAVLKS